MPLFGTRQFLLPFFLFFSTVRSVAQSPTTIIDSLQKEIGNGLTGTKYIEHCFTIADNFMEVDQYDSAQSWLNRLAEKLPLRQPSVSNYFLSSRQAEVYYYNGLQRLGLQEAQRSLSIAQALNDQLLLADSYNFIGLFYTNLDSPQKAIPFFLEGIKYARQPPYPSHYLSLSKPHHLFGNLAEAYEKLEQFDSALKNGYRSLQLARQISWDRGIAVAHNSLGSVLAKMGRPDSAVAHFNQSLKVAVAGGDVDVELIVYSEMAMAYDSLRNTSAAEQFLKKGFALVATHPAINDLFLGKFLDQAIAFYKRYGKQELLALALQQKSNLLRDQLANNNRQINSILNAGLANERRLLSLQVKEAEQQNEIANARTYLLLAILILVLAGFLFYRYKLKQKFGVIRLQNKISQDLHDDVGSSLSSMQVYSAVAERLMEERPDQAREMLKKISKESAIVLENIGDIIWSIKSERVQSLEERIKNFISDVLGAANIHYQLYVEENIESQVRNPEARKNILLLVKEAVNNTLKYSKAKHVSVSIKKLEGHLCVQITDDGIGFHKESSQRKGAGLSNMEQRTVKLGGIYQIITGVGKGTTVSALFPLTKISDGFR